MRLRSPLYAQIELTYACNQLCGHCYNESRFSNESGVVTPVTLKREPTRKEMYSEIANVLVEHDVFSVTLTGGEVLTVRDRLYPTIEVLARNGLDVSVNSNLTLLDEEDARRLVDVGVTSVLTSLMSHDEATHNRLGGRGSNFKQTLSGIELLQKYGIFTSVNMVVSQGNRDQVYPTGRFVASLGIDSFQASQVVPSASGGEVHLGMTLDSVTHFLEDMQRVREDTGMYVKLTIPVPYCSVWDERSHLRSLLETSRCTAGRTIMQIDPYGNVMPCPMVGERYGNILEEDLDTVWDRMQEWEDNKYVPETCRPCDLVEICRGGCRAEAERMVGSLTSKHPFSVKPVKVRDDYSIDFEPGTKLDVIEGLKFRMEKLGTYVLFSRDRFMMASEGAARYIAAVSKQGVVLDEKFIKDGEAMELITSAYHLGILRRAV